MNPQRTYNLIKNGICITNDLSTKKKSHFCYVVWKGMKCTYKTNVRKRWEM